MAPARNRKAKEKPDTAIPRFIIDLSLNPEERYVALAKQYRPQIQRLTSLFDDLLSDLGIPKGLHKSINGVARLLLRKVHSPIETAELRGISRTGGVPMYLLVALNVVLDLLMGCTSGAVRTVSEGQDPAEARMLHFRTLDWGMDPLRSVIVQLDYVWSRMYGEQVLGSSITYVGFVGVLTGVRKDLSLSLNFRAVHNAASKVQQFRFYFHHLLVLLGLRQSISSLLRSCLFNNLKPTSKGRTCLTFESYNREWHEVPMILEHFTETMSSKHTTSAYLICCTGRNCVSLEKDFATAIVRRSESFIVTTNHDLDQNANQQNDASPKRHAAAMQELIEESEDRRDCLVDKWQAKVRKERRRLQLSGNGPDSSTPAERRHTRSMRSSQQSLNYRENENRSKPQSLAAGGSGDAGGSIIENGEQKQPFGHGVVSRDQQFRAHLRNVTPATCEHFSLPWEVNCEDPEHIHIHMPVDSDLKAELIAHTKSLAHSGADTTDVERSMALTEEELVRWTTAFPTTNECTHFAAILDPRHGTILWSQRYLRPTDIPSEEIPRGGA